MEHFIWNVNPEIFSLGAFAPRWYGLLFALGFLIGYQWMQKVYREEGKPENDLSSLLFHMMLGTIIGARLGHTLFYEPGYYLANPLEILYVWKGGLASHGGALGIIIAVALYCRKHKDQPWLWIADRVAPAIAICSGCIRIGNFFNSEIIGKPSDAPWAVIFERVDNVPRHPAMLYEAICYFILAAILIAYYQKKKPNIRSGSMLGILFIGIFSARFFIEFVKENQVSFEESMALNMGQILSVPFVIVGILLFTGAYRRFLPSTPEPAAKAPAKNKHTKKHRS